MIQPTSNKILNHYELAPSKSLLSTGVGIYAGLKTFEVLSKTFNSTNLALPIEIFVMMSFTIPASIVAIRITKQLTHDILSQAHKAAPFAKKILLAAADMLPSENTDTAVKA